jgi:hypothetical protein
MQFVTALNDIRLVLGTILDVSEDEALDYAPDDPRYVYGALYGWVSELQYDLVELLGRELGEEGIE